MGLLAGVSDWGDTDIMTFTQRRGGGFHGFRCVCPLAKARNPFGIEEDATCKLFEVEGAVSYTWYVFRLLRSSLQRPRSSCMLCFRTSQPPGAAPSGEGL